MLSQGMDLFTSASNQNKLAPLAELLRPQHVSQIIGQERLKKSMVLDQLLSGKLVSFILWGPPGCGKTSIATAVSKSIQAKFIDLNAADSGVKQLREAGEMGRDRKLQFQERTVLFVDEIHRFNKGQQDVLLPYIEKGDLILIGATTENPSYELNRALLSRCRVIRLDRLNENDFKQMLARADQALGYAISESIAADALDWIARQSDGDGRRFIGFLEIIDAFLGGKKSETALEIPDVEKLLDKTAIGYDKKSSEHYDVISAFIKSIRGSDPDAALYYLARMLKAGEDPFFIARRVVISASEDVGNADPRAISVATSAYQALEVLGMPEGQWALAQAVTYLASAPKSNASYAGLKKALDLVDQTLTAPVPGHLRSASNEKQEAEIKYKYPHDFPKSYVPQSYFPEVLEGSKLYEPKGRGFEKNILDYLKWLQSKD